MSTPWEDISPASRARQTATGAGRSGRRHAGGGALTAGIGWWVRSKPTALSAALTAAAALTVNVQSCRLASAVITRALASPTIRASAHHLA